MQASAQRATSYGVFLDEASIPVSESVQSVCELLGFDPLHLACEGRVLAVVSAAATDAALHA
jgi:hydrogenase expression/formation protein HypE